MQLALKIECANNASQLVKVLDEKALSKETTSEIIELANAYGTSWCIKNMQVWLTRKYGMDGNNLILVDSLQSIIKGFIADSSKDSAELSNWLLKHQLKALIQAFDSEVKILQQAELDERASKRIKILTDLMLSSLIAKDFSVYDKLVSYTVSNKTLFPAVELTSVLTKTYRKCQKLDLAQPQYLKLKSHVFDRITSAQDRKPRSANDWSIKDKNRCNCDDCKILNKFLQSSSEQKMIWPIGKERRQHIHGIVDGMKLPITHVTERVGSPHKLHLTKTKQLFIREVVLRDKYKKALVLLEKY